MSDAVARSSADPVDDGQDAEQPFPAASQQRWTLIVLTTLYALSFLDRQIIALLVNSIRADLRVSDFQIGLLQGLGFVIFYVLFGLAFGWLVDRFARRSIIFGGVVIWSLAAAGCGVAHSFGQLFGARLGLGAGEAALGPAGYSMLADMFPRRRLATVVSVYSSGSALGVLASLLIGAALMAVLPRQGLVLPVLGLTAPWRLAFIFTGLPGLLFALLIWTIREPVRRGRRLANPTSFVGAWRYIIERWRFYWALFLALGLMSATGFATAAWSAAYLMRRFHLSISQTGMLMAATAILPAIVGMVSTGAITDRWFSKGKTDAHLWMLIILGVIQVVGLVLVMRAGDALAAALLLSVCLFFAGYSPIGAAALTMVTPNEFRGQVSSFMMVCLNVLGLGCGPPLAGWLATYVYHSDAMIGWAIASTYIILMPIAVLLLLSARKPMRQAVQEAEGWSGRR